MKAKLLTFLIIAIMLLSCSSEKEGIIVKDAGGNYYRLTNEAVLGSERYRLIEVDTASLKKF